MSRFSPISLGIILFMAANVLFAVTDAAAQYFIQFVGVQAFFLISLRFVTGQFSSMALGAVMAGPQVWRTSHLALKLIRSFLMACTTLTNFWAVKYLDLTVTVTIMFSAPFMVAGLAWLLLGERVGLHRIGAIAAGFLGVLVVFNPFGQSFHPAMFLSFGTALSIAGLSIVTRMGTSGDSLGTQTFYTTLTGAVLCFPFLFFGDTPLPGTFGGWFMLLSIGLIFGTGGHFCNVVAHRFAPASVLAPFMYTQLIWMAVAQYILHQTLPSWQTFVGAALVILSGLYLWHRQQLQRAQSGDEANTENHRQ